MLFKVLNLFELLLVLRLSYFHRQEHVNDILYIFRFSLQANVYHCGFGTKALVWKWLEAKVHQFIELIDACNFFLYNKLVVGNQYGAKKLPILFGGIVDPAFNGRLFKES